MAEDIFHNKETRQWKTKVIGGERLLKSIRGKKLKISYKHLDLSKAGKNSEERKKMYRFLGWKEDA